MNKIHEWVNTVLVALVLILVLVGGNHQSGTLGAAPTTNLPSIGVAQLDVGSGCGDNFTTCTGTDTLGIVHATCNLVGQSGSDTIVAGGIATTSCAVTGALTTDTKVWALLSNASTTIGVTPVVVQAARASSTAGFVTVFLYNATSSANQVTRVGTSTQVLIFR